MEICSAEQGYDAIAARYDGWKWQKLWAALEQPFIAAMLEGDRGRLPLRVLDIGVGTGRNLGFIQQAFGRAVCEGVDLSDGMLAIAREKLKDGTRLEKGNARRLYGFESSTFSHALLCRVSSHIDNMWPVVAEATRVVLPSGKILVTDLHPEHNYKNTHCHTGERTIHIETYKHDGAHWQRMARNLGLGVIFERVVRGADIAALQGVEVPRSILGPESPVAMMMVLQKL